MKIKAVYF